MNGLMSLPLIIYVPQYMDDYIRSYSGEYGWLQNARPLAELFYGVINLGPPATSAGPLYLIVALLIGSVISVMIARAFEIRSPLWTALATLPLLGQPYFLQNLSFNFDVVMMTSGLALALLAALVAREARTPARIAISILTLLASLLFYQASNSAFLAIGAAFVIANWLGIPSAANFNKNAKSSKPGMLKTMLLVYITSISLCAALANSPLVPKDGYTTKNSGTSLSIISLLQIFTSNVKVQIGVFIRDWAHSPGGIIALFSLITCSLVLAILILNKRLQRRVNLTTFIYLISTSIAISLTLLLILVFSPGALYILRQSFAGTPRTNVFVGPWLTSLNLLTLSALRLISDRTTGPTLAINAISHAAVASMAWLLLVFSFTYGSATHSQIELQKSLISRIIGAASALRYQSGSDNPPDQILVSLSGPVPRSPALVNSTNKFPLLKHLVLDFGLPELTWYGLTNAIPEVPLKMRYGFA